MYAPHIFRRPADSTRIMSTYHAGDDFPHVWGVIQQGLPLCGECERILSALSSRDFASKLLRVAVWNDDERTLATLRGTLEHVLFVCICLDAYAWERGSERLLRRGITLLNAAAIHGSCKAAAALLEAGVSPNATDWNDCTPLFWAASRGHADMVSLLVAARADVDRRVPSVSCTALFEAVLKDQASTVAVLLDAGADANTGDGWNSTAIGHAAEFGQAATVALLLDAKADVGLQGALLGAVRRGRVAIMSMLLAGKADVDGETRTSTRPISVAAQYGCQAAAALLLDAKADVHLADRAGITPLLDACMSYHEHVAALLWNHGKAGAGDMMTNSLRYAEARGFSIVVAMLRRLEAGGVAGNHGSNNGGGDHDSTGVKYSTRDTDDESNGVSDSD
jgi:ankyrin repeat protein